MNKEQSIETPAVDKKQAKRDKWAHLSNHILYEAAVQDVDIDYTFFQRVFRSNYNRRASTLREDFCGTALLCCEWVRQNPDNHAWGVDLDEDVLEWSRANRICELSEAQQRRLHVEKQDVLNVVSNPKVDIVCALNFSYSYWKQRSELITYFKKCYDNLSDEGVLIIDAYGGPTSMDVTQDKRKVPKGSDWAGNPYPSFTYNWDQAYFNFINNHTVCNIHFKLPGGAKRKKAFSYDWRLWGLPELKDILLECGFRKVDTYLEGWDEDAEETDGVLRKRNTYEHMLAWFSYLAAVK